MSSNMEADLAIEATDLDGTEHKFVAFMDAVQEYLQLQSRLQSELKQGRMSLARAKYSMGPIGQAQYDMDMEASVRVTVNSDSDGNGSGTGDSYSVRYSFALRKQPHATASRPSPPLSSTSASCATSATVSESALNGIVGGEHRAADTMTTRPAVAAAVPGSSGATDGDGGGASSSVRGAIRGNTELVEVTVAAAAGSGGGGGCELADEFEWSEGDEEGLDEEDDGLREANEFLRRMRLQAEAEDGGEGSSRVGARERKQPTRHRRRRRGDAGGGGGGGSDPLHWFGVLVPPPMKEAQTVFQSVLETCLLLANAAQRLALPDSSKAMDAAVAL